MRSVLRRYSAPRLERRWRRALSSLPSSSHADVIVVGGGHAGCEAATAAARLGARTLLVTQRTDTVGEMACNPSIGGVGKGHLVTEIDALGGIMGRCADEAGIHFRMLNRSKGPAVRGPRAQADRDLYKAAVQREIFGCENLSVVEASVDDLVVADGAVGGVRLAGGEVVRARAVVITAGTFLRGRVHLGRQSRPAGRYVRDGAWDEVEPPATALALTLEQLGLPIARLKTGTPPRLDGATIDWEHPSLEVQPSEESPAAFSFLHAQAALPLAPRLVDCYRATTNAATHAIVARSLHTLPVYETGGGAGVGVRYCPSLNTKVARFPERDSHVVWLEPEGLHTTTVYPNGIAGAFDVDVQQRIVRSIGGLERAELLRPGYDVEYDFVEPRCLRHTLEVRACAGLYLAGQIIGTTGYEEAASLGLHAGLNAALRCAGRAPFELGRGEAYLGVLVDDLVTRGTQEPYRMFTSRAEHRLLLRADNADERLTPRGAALGCVSAERVEVLHAKRRAIDEGRAALARLRLPAAVWAGHGFELQPHGNARSAEQVLAMPGATLAQVERVVHLERHKLHHRGAAAEDLADEPPAEPAELTEAAVADSGSVAAPLLVAPVARDSVEVAIKYSDYVERQEREVARLRRSQAVALPSDLDYGALAGLSCEEVEKLSRARPRTLEEAGRISGVTPASIIALLSHVRGKEGWRHDEGTGRKSRQKAARQALALAQRAAEVEA